VNASSSKNRSRACDSTDQMALTALGASKVRATPWGLTSVMGRGPIAGHT
jgi:hypothetical protein